jgi:glucokinase
MSKKSGPASLAIAADIGGTNMRAALVTRGGELLSKQVLATEPERGIEDAARRLARMIGQVRTAAGAETIAGAGVSTAGPVDPSTGVYNHPPNLTGWHGRTMRPLLGKETGLNVWTGHDATLAALAETRYGAHRGVQNLVYVTVSTGVGGGIIANGQMVTGASGGAGEVGHVYVRPGGYACNVGCDGCFEGNASGPAIARMAADMIRGSPRGVLSSMSGGDPAKITSRMVFEAAADGDPVATKALDTALENIGMGLASLLNVFDPEALVIGGGVIDGLKSQMDRLHAAVLKHALPRYKDRGLPMHVTTLGDEVSLLGAAVLAFRRADELN